MTVRNQNWYALNGTRRWPIDDGATGEDDAGASLRNDVLVDAAVRVPADLCALVAVSSVTVTKSLVTVTLVGVAAHPVAPAGSSSAAAPEFVPLGVVSVPKPVVPGRPYPVRPLAAGVGGWLVFGDGLGKSVRHRFSTPEQAVLAPRACRAYRRPPVTSIGKQFAALALAGVVRVLGGTDVEVVAAEREIEGVERDVIVVRLRSNTPRNLFDQYRGPCGGRPESRTCNRDGVEFINTVGPDCDGDIRVEFVSPLRTSYYAGGVALDYPYGLIDACTRDDRLPAASGKLPNEYPDECAVSSVGDPDANAARLPPILGAGANITLPDEVSSEAVSPAALPVTLHFDAGWEAVHPTTGAWTLVPRDSPNEPAYQQITITPYTAYDEVVTVHPYIEYFDGGVQDCGACSDGASGAWSFVLAGGTGDMAGANGAWTVTPAGGCLWTATQGGWTATLNAANIVETLIVTDGVVSQTYGTADSVPFVCCGTNVLEMVEGTGTGDPPAAPVLTAVGPCGSSSLSSAVSSSSSLVPRDATSSEVSETRGPDQAAYAADVAVRNIALWAGSIGTGSAGVRTRTDVMIGNGAGIAGLLFNYRGAVAGGFQYWAVELSRADSRLQIRHWNGLAWVTLVSAGPLVVAANTWYTVEGSVEDLGGGTYRLTARARTVTGAQLAAITTDVGDYGPADGYLGIVADRTLAAYSYLRVEAHP